jgi:hypothetical protein
MDISQIDFKLQCIQEEIDKIADAIYNQNAIRSRSLKVCGFNIGCVREDIERAAQNNDDSPAIPQRAQLAIALMEKIDRFDKSCPNEKWNKVMAEILTEWHQ